MILDIFFILGILYIIRELDYIYFNIFKRKTGGIDIHKAAEEAYGDMAGKFKEILSIDLSRDGIIEKLCVSWILYGIFFTDESQLFKYLLFSNCAFSILSILNGMIQAANVLFRGQEQDKDHDYKHAKYWNIISRSVKTLLIIWILYTHFISNIVYA